MINANHEARMRLIEKRIILLENRVAQIELRAQQDLQRWNSQRIVMSVMFGSFFLMHAFGVV